MTRILEGLTLKTYGCAVRLTLGNQMTLTTRANPSAQEVVAALTQLQGYYPNAAQQQVCSRAAEDARRVSEKVEIDLGDLDEGPAPR